MLYTPPSSTRRRLPTTKDEEEEEEASCNVAPNDERGVNFFDVQAETPFLLLQ